MPTIDPTHAPFKRTRTLGRGPKKREPVDLTGDWVCEKRPKTKTHYVQMCKWVGDGKKKPRKVKRSIKAKKEYNALYQPWYAKNRKDLASKGARRGYRCRSTPVSKCGRG